MLSIGVIKSGPGAAAKYYTVGDYYSKDGDEPSAWTGQGAAKLGLNGPVDTESLTKVLQGTIVGKDDRGWGDHNHRPGWDLTFSAPKSVSILAIIGGDKRLIEAHEKAVDSAVKFLEKNTHVRERKPDGTIDYKKTGNLVSAKFTEFFSRSLDPQLHTHVPTANMTWDEDRQQWYSIDSKAFFTLKMAAGQIYRNSLAKDIRGLPYEITDNKETGLFEIKGIPEALIEETSQARAKIEKLAAEKDWKTAREFAKAALLTRDNKSKTNHQDVVTSLKTRAQKYQSELNSLIHQSKIERAPKDAVPILEKSADKAASHGISHLTSREAVIEHGHVIQEALKVSIGSLTIDDIEAALDRKTKEGLYIETSEHSGPKHIYNGRTTNNSIGWEKRLQAAITTVRNQVRPLANSDKVHDYLSTSHFTDEQKTAIKLATRTSDRAIAIAGVAGAGKSFLVRAIKELAPTRNYLAIAPTATAAVDLGESAKINSKTITSFLQTGGHSVSRNSVLFVDESSMATTRQIVRLLDIANQKKARVVFLGDTKQFDAIEQGKPFALMQQMGLRNNFLSHSYRQKNPTICDLVATARQGNIKEVFSLLGNRLEEHDDQIIASYVAQSWLANSNRDKIQIAALENNSRIAINQEIREALQSEGKLGNENINFEVLSSKAHTQAQLSIADYYKKGDTVVFHLGQKRHKIDKGTEFEVLSKKKNKVELKDKKSGKTLLFDPKRDGKKGINLYNSQTRQLSKHDKIQWRQNHPGRKDIKNGHTGKILWVKGTKAKIQFDHGTTATLNLKDNKYWDHAYAITSFKQQGKTTPINWIVANTQKAGEINQKSLYVSLTRAERSVKVFTDDAKRLKSSLEQNPGGKTSSLEATGVKTEQTPPPEEPEKDSKITKFIDKLPQAVRSPIFDAIDAVRDFERTNHLHKHGHIQTNSDHNKHETQPEKTAEKAGASPQHDKDQIEHER